MISCYYPECLCPARAECDNCSKKFCGDHGSVGGDVPGDENSLTQAYPSLCWKCGGFNVDG